MSITGTTARYEQAEVDAATGIIEAFVEPDTKAPRPAFDITRLAVMKCTADPRRNPSNPQDLAYAMFRVQELLRSKAVYDKFEQPVVLPVGDDESESVYGDLPWPTAAPWHTSAPRIVFCAVSSTDAGLHTLAGHAISGIALYFDPALVGRIPVRVKNQQGEWVQDFYRDPQTGELIAKTEPDKFNPLGYIACVGSYASIPTTMEARQDLMRAITVLTTPPVDDTEPEFGSLDEAENMPDLSDWNTL